jgi:ubiquinol-cytochrome c reductase cytochrome c subunit
MRTTAVIASVALLLAVDAHAAVDGPTAAGKRLYGRYCVACHGDNGYGVTRPRTAGAGPLRAQTTQRAVGPSLRGVGALAADFYLRTGYMPLPRIGVAPRRRRPLDEAQIRALTAFVASLGRGPAVPTPHPEQGDLSAGQRLFTEHCAGCHQIAARGGYVPGAVPPALDRATPTQIAEAVRIGPNVMPRFSRRSIDDRELDSIIRYVGYARHPDDPGGWAIGHIGPVPEGLVTWFLGAAALLAVCLTVGRRLHG